MATTTSGTPFSINSFRSKGMKDGGARPSLFEISWTDDDAAYTMGEPILVKAGSIPTSNIAPLTVNYGGRAYKLQGFRTFDVWTVTILQDENFAHRQNIMGWMRKVAGGMDGSRYADQVGGGPQGATGTTWNYTGTAIVKQFDKQGTVSQTYKFFNLWPTELAEIPLDWASDAIEEYTVTFCYDYWTHGTTTAKLDDVVGDDKPSGSVGGTSVPSDATATTAT